MKGSIQNQPHLKGAPEEVPQEVLAGHLTMPRFTAFEGLLEEGAGGEGELMLLAEGSAELFEGEGELPGAKGGERLIVINAPKVTLQLIKGQAPDAVLHPLALIVGRGGDRLVHRQPQVLGGERKGEQLLAQPGEGAVGGGCGAVVTAGRVADARGAVQDPLVEQRSVQISTGVQRDHVAPGVKRGTLQDVRG